MELNDVAMTFWEHLEELRRRIIICLIFLGVFTVLGLTFRAPIRYVLDLPMKSPVINMVANAFESWGGEEGSILGFLALSLQAGGSIVDARIIVSSPGSGIMAYIILGVTAGVLLSLPIILYQIWMFIFPALNKPERRLALPLFFTILFFFVVGCLFAYFLVVPVVLQFAAGLFPENENLWDLRFYISFVTVLILGFGIAFELPIVMAFLARIGIIGSRGFRSKQRHALMGITVLSALLTPADPASMLLMAIPLFILYQLGIFFAFLVEKEVVD